MNISIEVKDYSDPALPCIRIHNAWADGEKVEIEINGERHKVLAEEMISAIKKATLNCFGY